MPDTLRDPLQAALGDNFTIERELGGGGMSRVFVAMDASLQREIVVKVLPSEAAEGLSAERFKREIMLAARLQHPHIVPLLSAGVTAQRIPFYTMPFVSGESLRQRLTREGELPVAEVIGLLRQVARALAYAHENGIVHRDIKPDNVMLSGGAAMVLDFGVAKAVSESVSPGGSATLTGLGVALGTPAYMAPEQAVGDGSVDQRADIYALGCMAYEMLTGRPPFSGRNTQAVLTAHVMDNPEPLQKLRGSVPPQLAALVMQCLEKRPADRPQTAAQLVRDLDAIPLTPAGTTYYAGAPARTRAATVQRWVPWIIAALAVGTTAVISLRRTDATGSHDLVRFTVPGIADPAINGAPAITPDGRTLVYVDPAEVSHSLYVRPLNELHARRLPGTEGAAAPFISPDGRWVAFATSASKLKKVPLDGSSEATAVTDANALARGTWGSHDVIVLDGKNGLEWVPAAGGARRPLTVADKANGEAAHRDPRMVDERHVLFTVSKGDEDEVGVVTIDTTLRTASRHILTGVRGRPFAMWNGWLLVLDGGALSAVRFDIEKAKASGSRVAVNSGEQARPIAIANNGTLLSTRQILSDSLLLVDDKGASQPIAGALPPVTVTGPTIRGYMEPRLTSDGKRMLLMGAKAQGFDLWMIDMVTRTRSLLTTSGIVFAPDLSLDGRSFVYSTTRARTADAETDVWIQPSDGSGAPRRIVRSPFRAWGTLTPDAQTVVLQQSLGDVWSIWTVPTQGGEPTALIKESYSNYMPRVSPDGHWLAFVSGREELEQVYVRPFPGPGVAYRVSDAGGTEPMWSPDGHRLFYRAGKEFIAASLVTAPQFSVASRRTLFSASYDSGMPHANYAVMPDGAHFIFLTATSRSAQDGVVTLNWTSELRERLESRNSQQP